MEKLGQIQHKVCTRVWWKPLCCCLRVLSPAVTLSLNRLRWKRPCLKAVNVCEKKSRKLLSSSCLCCIFVYHKVAAKCCNFNLIASKRRECLTGTDLNFEPCTLNVEFNGSWMGSFRHLNATCLTLFTSTFFLDANHKTSLQRCF